MHGAPGSEVGPDEDREVQDFWPAVAGLTLRGPGSVEKRVPRRRLTYVRTEGGLRKTDSRRQHCHRERKVFLCYKFEQHFQFGLLIAERIFEVK